MFAITSTRIVGLVAVLCAVVVAQQAHGATSAQSRIDPPAAVQLSGHDLIVFDNLPGYRQQQEFLAAVATRLHKSSEAAANAAAIAALQRRSAALDAMYRKLYASAYTQAVQKTDAPVRSIPSFCNDQAMVDYDYIIYSLCQG